MRKLILFATCSFIINFNHASAQILGGNVATETTQLLSWAKQQADNLRQLKQLYDQYIMAQRMWNAVYGARDVSQMMAALGEPTRRFLPDASFLVEGIGDGARMVTGAGGIRSANQIFSALPRAARGLESGARWIDEMNRKEITTANVQATANKAIGDIESRISKLNFMQARISLSSDVKDIETVRASIAVEQQNLALHNASMQALQLKLMAADRMETARREQVEAQGAARWAEATQASVDALQGD